MEEQIQNIDGIDIKYMFQPSKYESRHLLVIFSGFGDKTNSIYNYIGKTKEQINGNILWIKDDFFGDCTYYLCQKSVGFQIEHAIIKFINNFIKKEYFDFDNTTVLGCAKGGWAALYFGIKYYFKNIISTAPQVRIASFLKEKFPNVLSHMVNRNDDELILDNLLYKEIDETIKNNKQNKNIYLVSSEVDQFETCNELAIKLQKFSNFNHIKVCSSIVRKHNEITAYCVPTVISIINSLSQGLIPTYGHLSIIKTEISEQNKVSILDNKKKKQNLINELLYLRCVDGKLHIDGVSYYEGYPCSKDNLSHKKLSIKNSKFEKKFELSNYVNSNFNKKYFDTMFIPYEGIGFICNNGSINLKELPTGIYELKIENSFSSICKDNYINCDEAYKAWFYDDVHFYRFFEKNSFLYLQVYEIVSKIEPDYFKLEKKWLKNKVIHYEGSFVKFACEAKEWSEFSPFLIFKSQLKTYVFPYAKQDLKSNNMLFDGAYDYSKSNFCSFKEKGIDISNIIPGNYSVYLSACVNKSVISKFIEELTINNEQKDNVLTKKYQNKELFSIREELKDENNNEIILNGENPQNCKVQFVGCNNILIIESNANINNCVFCFKSSNSVIKIGKCNSKFSATINIGKGCHITIGDNNTSTNPVYITCAEQTTLEIGNDCMFATNNRISTDDAHAIFNIETNERINISKNIKIGNHVWIAFDAWILGGTNLGDGCVVGAKSLLKNKVIPNNCVVAGIPAKIIKNNIYWKRPNVWYEI